MASNRNIWVVMRGELRQGGTILGLFASAGSATAECDEAMKNNGPWVMGANEPNFKQWTTTGGDWVYRRKMAVRK